VDRAEQEKERPIVEYLVHMLQLVSWVDHVRFYPIHPKCLDGTWPDGQISKSEQYGWEHFGYPALADGEQSCYGVQKETSWIFNRIMKGV
jgi:hypothetical protein